MRHFCVKSIHHVSEQFQTTLSLALSRKQAEGSYIRRQHRHIGYKITDECMGYMPK